MNAVVTPSLAPDQEFTLSAGDFERIRKLIYQRAGISLHAGKQAMVYSRLSRRLRETGHRSFSDYLQALEARRRRDAEWQEFVNCLTTNLTAFFREDHHFHALVDDLRARGTQPVRIWCNAASTGEEPYSLAMTVVETLGASAQARAAVQRHRHQGAGHRAARRLRRRRARPEPRAPAPATSCAARRRTPVSSASSRSSHV